MDRFKKFSLSEKEKGGKELGNRHTHKEVEEGNRSLVGKIFGERKMNFYGVKNAMERPWRQRGLMGVEKIQTNTFQFIFTRSEDREAILRQRPWSFDSHFLVLQKWEEEMDYDAESFNFTPIWVQIWNVSRHWVSRKTGLELGELIGDVKDAIIPDVSGTEYRHIKVLVEMDLRKPLERGTMVKYKGHLEKGCETRASDLEMNKLKEGQFGPWLRAGFWKAERREASTKKKEEDGAKGGGLMDAITINGQFSGKWKKRARGGVENQMIEGECQDEAFVDGLGKRNRLMLERMTEMQQEGNKKIKQDRGEKTEWGLNPSSNVKHQDFIFRMGMDELQFEGREWTWAKNRRGEGYIEERLDRVFGSAGWLLEYPLARVIHVKRHASDHCLLFMDLSPVVQKRKVRFCFDRRWLNKEGIKEAVEKAWNSYCEGSPMHKVAAKIKLCRMELLKWSRGQALNSEKAIRSITQEMDQMKSQESEKEGMEVDGICSTCGNEVEDLEHVLFHCTQARRVWLLAPVSWEGMQQRTNNFADWWEGLMGATQTVEFMRRVECTVYILWHLWKSRNAWQFGQERTDAWSLVKRAEEEWQEAGVGYYARKENGELLVVVADSVDFVQNYLAAELIAIRMAMMEAQRRRFQKVEIQIDEKTMVTWLQGKTISVSDVSAIVDDIFLVKLDFECCKFVFIKKQ
ncbi:OLC1v1035730C1 [Oldenlandia corymbosa var. corymbosa]|uniref:OLC1v1035730C1 n=1 Tax=Oldenlandia corymbosa var. corymbosa TaxID=529605 RepID=A0AAV1CWV3_OLDCO|nr:OLC1v1035730C1 [Oldenlandia corymbosa var. corymbosa]